MNQLQTLQTEARAEFYEKCGHVISTSSPSNFSAVNESIDSLTRRAYLLGVEEARKTIKYLPFNSPAQSHNPAYVTGYATARKDFREALTRLSEVKKQVV
jgi:hypothetical protein